MIRPDRSDRFTASGRRLVTDPPVRRAVGQTAMQPDFELRDVGSLAILDPLNDRAESWAEDCLDRAVLRWGRAFVIEWRYVAAILEGLEHDGLTVSPAPS